MQRKNRGISRRKSLSGSAVGIASLTLGLRCLKSESESEVAAPTTTPAAVIRYGEYTDIWRERFLWDKVVKSSHARANCISACSWNLFVDVPGIPIATSIGHCAFTRPRNVISTRRKPLTLRG